MLFGVILVIKHNNNDIIAQESYNGMRVKQLFYCCFSFGQRILYNNDV